MFRLRYAALLVCLLLPAAAGLAIDQPPDEEDVQALLGERLKTAAKFFEATRVAYEADTVTLDLLIMAEHALFEAERDAASGDREQMQALRSHLARLLQIEDKIQKLFEGGARGGESEKYYEIKFERETAQLLVLRAKKNPNLAKLLDELREEAKRNEPKTPPSPPLPAGA